MNEDPKSLELEEKQLELEREKLKLERKKDQTDRYKARLRLYTALGIMIIGTLGVCLINHFFEERQLAVENVRKATELEIEKARKDRELKIQEQKARSEERQAEMKYLGEYLKHALENDPTRRMRFSEYFAKLTNTPELKTKWETYHQGIVNDLKQLTEFKAAHAQAEKDGNLAEVARLDTQIALLEPKVVDLRRRDKQVAWKPSNIGGYNCDHFPELKEFLPLLIEPHRFGESVTWRLQRTGIEVGDEPLTGKPGGAVVVRQAWEKFGEYIRVSAEKHRVPAELILALLANQSPNLDPRVVHSEPYSQSSPGGQVTQKDESVGLMRVCLSTARKLTGNQSITREWLQDPKNNIDVATLYLAQYQSQ
jgi:hypothetical protein